MTHFTTLPSLTWLSGVASFTEAVTMSPSPAFNPASPPIGRMHISLRAPELSATVSQVRIIIIISAPLSFLLGGRFLRQHFFQSPALEARKRAGGNDAYGVPLLGLALLVVGIEFLGNADHAAVLRVLHEPLHFDHDGLGHLGAGNLADEFGFLAALGAGRRWRRFCLRRCLWCCLRFRCHYSFPALAVFAPAFIS